MAEKFSLSGVNQIQNGQQNVVKRTKAAVDWTKSGFISVQGNWIKNILMADRNWFSLVNFVGDWFDPIRSPPPLVLKVVTNGVVVMMVLAGLLVKAAIRQLIWFFKIFLIHFSEISIKEKWSITFTTHKSWWPYLRKQTRPDTRLLNFE